MQCAYKGCQIKGYEMNSVKLAAESWGGRGSISYPNWQLFYSLAIIKERKRLSPGDIPDCQCKYPHESTVKSSVHR